MLLFTHKTVVRRLLTTGAALAAALGASNCATLSGSNGTLGVLGLGSSHAALLSDVLNGAGGTYIGRVLAERDSTIERWPAHLTDPIKVWIESSRDLPEEQVNFPDAVRDAFSTWSQAGIPLRFMFVTDPGEAQIKVRWTDHLAHKTGSTTWRTDRAGWMTSSDIMLATHTSTGAELDERGMRAIALHEVGHSLGMSHSVDSHDVMAALVRVDDLSDPDRNTIRYLYSLPAGRVR